MNKLVVKLLRSAIPFIMGVCLLCLLTAIIFSGGKRNNFPSLVEPLLIERALVFAKYPAKHPGLVKTITLSDYEIMRFPPAPRSTIRDANISVYARVLAAALAVNPRIVILNWLHGAHFEDIQYYKPVLDVIDREKAHNKVLLTFPTIYLTMTPKELRAKYRILEGEDCISDLNITCVISNTLENWTNVILAKLLWQNRRSFALTTNLPQALPSVIANLPDPESIPNYSFSDVLDSTDVNPLSGAQVIAIGADVAQNPIFKNNKDEIQKTFIGISNPRRSLMEDGLPHHRFWAALCQMFMEDESVAVPPHVFSFILALIVATFILFILVKAGSGFALVIYMVTVIIYFILNCLALRYLRIYMPMFDIIYVGLLAVILSVFIAISRTLFKHFSILAEQEGMSELVDLKQNFISLISHNLNTPIAKFKGLLDLLKSRPIYGDCKAMIDRCLCLSAELQFLVRTVLLGSSLQQKSILTRDVTIRQLRDEILDYVKGFGDAFGQEYTCHASEEFLLGPQRKAIEIRQFTHALLAILLSPQFKGRSVRMNLTSDDDNNLFIVTAVATSPAVPGATVERSFRNESSEAYINDFLAAFGAQLTQDPDEDGFILIM